MSRKRRFHVSRSVASAWRDATGAHSIAFRGTSPLCHTGGLFFQISFFQDDEVTTFPIKSAI
jgi:hypothetical protein